MLYILLQVGIHITVTCVWLLTGNSRPTTPVESDNNNSGTETVGTNSVDGAQNGIDSYTGYNSLPAQHDIDNALASIGNQVITPASASVSANTTKIDSSSVIKKKNKRSKHTKSCEIDYEELEKALAIAAANAVVPAGSRVDPMGVSTGSAKKKGHRRVKSGSGPKVDLDPGNDSDLLYAMELVDISLQDLLRLECLVGSWEIMSSISVSNLHLFLCSTPVVC